MDQVLDLRRDAPAEDQLGQDEYDTAAIQRREWEQVEDTEADGQRGEQFERADGLVDRVGGDGCGRSAAVFTLLASISRETLCPRISKMPFNPMMRPCSGAIVPRISWAGREIRARMV
jgi:hypothetical protein